jgi:hypothetical protein
MPGILTYFALAVLFLIVVILAVPSDDTKQDAPLAIGPALLIPKAQEKGPSRP